MAGGSWEAGLTVAESVAVIRRSWMLVLGSVAVSAVAAMAFVMLSTPSYRAEASMYVSVRAAGSTSPVDLTQGGSYARQAVISYAAVIRNPIVLDRVISDLGLSSSSDELARDVVATTPADSVLIDVSVSRTDPVEAAAIANAIAASFTLVVEDVIEAPQDGGPSAVRVTTIREASVPDTPVSPAPVQSVGLGVVLGTLMGVALAFLRSTFGTRLRTVDDLRRVTSLPVLGEILADASAEKHVLVVHADPHNPKSESFRSLRTNLQFVNAEGRPRSFLFTSGSPNEGKTTVACNLAISLAQTGVSVVLVDADLRNPTVAHYMGADPVLGLSNVLAGLVPLDDALQPWREPGLSVLTSGRIPPNPSELLASAEMSILQADLTSRFDYVILDSPPVLAVTDAAALSGVVGNTVIVVSTLHSRRGELLATITALDGVARHVSGLVLTGVSARGSGTYRYGYGRYRSDNSPHAA